MSKKRQKKPRSNKTRTKAATASRKTTPDPTKTQPKQDAGFRKVENAGDAVVDDSKRAQRLHENKQAAATRVEDAKKHEELKQKKKISRQKSEAKRLSVSERNTYLNRDLVLRALCNIPPRGNNARFNASPCGTVKNNAKEVTSWLTVQNKEKRALLLGLVDFLCLLIDGHRDLTFIQELLCQLIKNDQRKVLAKVCVPFMTGLRNKAMQMSITKWDIIWQTYTATVITRRVQESMGTP